MRSYSRRRTTKMPQHYYEHIALDAIPTWVRFIPGNYETKIYIPERDEMETLMLPFFRYRRHWDQGIRKFIPCSAGDDPDFAAEPCIGCTKGHNPQDVFAYTVIHLDWFHEVPWIKGGEVQVNRKTGKPFMNLQPCEDKGCKICRTDGEEARIFGRKAHLTLGYSHKNFLSTKAEQLRVYCKCGEKIQVVKMRCPRCEKVLIDMDTTELSKKQIIEYKIEGMTCNKCGRKMQLVDEYDCDCGEPTTNTLYDVDVSIRKIVVSEKSSTLDIEFAKPGPLDEKYKGEKDPYDFAEVFKPPNIESQRMIYGYQGPITNVSEDSATEKYGD